MSVTLRDVARVAGTSVAAASCALSGRTGGSIRVSVETRQRILRAAEELGYSPNPIARSLATGKTYSIGLVFPYSDAFFDQNPFCTHVMRGVFKSASRANYNTMLFTAQLDDRDGVEHALAGVKRVDGMVIVCPDPSGPLVKECRRSNLPCVLVVSPTVKGFHTINSDDELGGYLGTKHFIDLGHRRVGLLTGQDSISTSELRKKGYLRALDEAGIPVDPALISRSGFDSWHGYSSMHQFLQLPTGRAPTAVFACNDLCANGAIVAIRDAGLRVPEDIAVLGYDDTEFCETTDPPLTSVRMHIDELGVSAVEQLVQIFNGQIEEATDMLLPVALIVRHSCGGQSSSTASGQPTPRAAVTIRSNTYI